MELYWCSQTRASRIVWMLEEAGLDYDRIEVDLRVPRDQRDPKFLSASPMGKVPALVDGEIMMADSATICLYVADRYGTGTLAPPFDHRDRGWYLYWMTFTPGVIEPAMAEKAGGWEPNPTRNGWGSFDLMIQTLQRGLESGPWLLGDQFTAADVMVGSSAAFMQRFKMLPPSPEIEAYVERCVARPAFQKAMSLEG